MDDFLVDIDIDSNFISDNYQNVNDILPDDNYYDVPKFNNVFHGDYRNDLKIFHLNIRSLPRNGDALIAYLYFLKQKFDIICLTETWLNDNRFIENIFPEYNQFHSMRPADQPPGGGVAVLVDRRLQSEELSDITCNNNFIECIFVKIKINYEEIVVASCYRKPDPSQAQLFISAICEKITTIGQNINKVIAGDFNFNLLQLENDLNASSFLDSMLSLGLIHTISRPTRDVNNSLSLLDNIFISNSIAFNSGLFCWDISDHYPIFSFLKNIFSTTNQPEIIKYRVINETSINNLRDSISKYNFAEILQTENLDFAIEKLDEILLSQFNQHCPILSKKLTRKDKEKPWINSHIKRLLTIRRNAYLTRKQNPENLSFDQFKRIRNFVTGKINESKKTYFSNLFKEIKGNMKKIWTVLNELLKPNINRRGLKVKSLLIDGKIFDDNSAISNIFNNHFSSIGSKISQEFQEINHQITTSNSISNSFFFRNIQTNDVVQIIDRMKNKSCPINSYPVKVIKELKAILSSILAHIINKSLTNGYFPSKMKIARVLPLHKGGSKNELNNFRPISILPIFSKIFERVVHNQLYSFLEKFKLLNTNQFGFRKNKSTVQAILDQLEFVYNNLDQSNTVISIFMDFSKAFDCIDHTILLKKLYYYGIRGVPYQWFGSYLSDRKQYVSVNDTLSDVCQVTHGVPQGSILGPLLFLIFINDFPDVNPFFKYSLFADDSTLTCKFSTSDETIIKNKIENELEIIYLWLKMNKIKINYDKSKFIVFSYGKKYFLQNLKFGDGVISSTDSTRFLGIVIDKNLNFKAHVSAISSKISKTVGLLFRLNNVLPIDTLKSLYSSLLLPHLLYGIEVWYGVLQNNNDRIFKLQKKAIRAINSLPYNTHTNEFFKSMKILKLEDIYKHRVLIFMFKSHNNFLTQAYNHSHFTRNRENLIIPRYQRAKTQSTFFYRSINLWNNLPNHIGSIQYVGAFSNAVKSLLLGNY